MASRGQSAGDAQWGVTVDGIQMSISLTTPGRVDVPEFQIAFRNSGTQDVTLNVGIMLANGRVQLPDKIDLDLTDANGQTRRLKFGDKRYLTVAGRVDDYLIPLRSGSIYTLKVSLDQFWSPETKEFDLKLTPGKYQITAHFEGTGARAVNLDTRGIDLLNFWKGKIQSNTLAIER
jgi:hypothetical protein